MQALSKDMKLLTLSLLLRTMPKNQQSLLKSHFSPEVIKRLDEIERLTGESKVEQLDWTPFYQSWPELKRILNECREEIKQQNLIKSVEEQRPMIKDYILMKLGKKKKGMPVILSSDITKIIDQYIMKNK